MLSKREKRSTRGGVCFFFTSVHCAVIGTVQAKDMGQGSDMQGTPPRDLRVFMNLLLLSMRPFMRVQYGCV